MIATASGWRVGGLLCALALAVGLTPSAAGAATVSVSGSTLSVVDPSVSGAGEPNNITITQTAGQFVVTDTATNPTAGSGCAAGGSPNAVSCLAGVIGTINVQASRNDDRVELATTISADATIDGGNGLDTLIGGGGDDSLMGGTPNTEGDVMLGGPGTDTADYGDRTTVLYVGIGNNGSTGEVPPTANVTLLDSSVVAVLRDDGRQCDPPIDLGSCEQDGVAPDFENLAGGEGNDELLGDGSANSLSGNKGNDILRGGDGGDRLDGGTNSDELNGDGDNDYLGTDPGSDAIRGGDGPADVVDYSQRTNPVTVNTNDDEDGEVGENDDVDFTVENVIGGSGADTISMFGTTQLSNIIDGGPGGDFIDASGSQDCVDYSSRTEPVTVVLNLVSDQTDAPNSGGASDGNSDHLKNIECVFGGAGNDVLVGHNSDTAVSGFGTNAFFGGPGNDFLDGRGGPDFLDGGSNPAGQPTDRDTVSYTDRSRAVEVSLDGQANDGQPADLPFDDPAHEEPEGDNVTPAVEVVIGSAFDDELTGGDPGPGDDGADELHGGGGADALHGLGGFDSLLGEGGNDVDLDSGEGGAVIDGGAGNDGLRSRSGAPDTLIGGADNDTLSYAERLTPMTISAGAGADDGTAGEGDDVGGDIETLIGGHSDDVVTGSSLSETIRGGDGDDTIDGAGGNDALIGEGGNDVASYSSHSSQVAASLGGSSGNGSSGESDTIDGSIERLSGGPGPDILAGTGGSDLINGAGGEDTISGLGGGDELYGASGNDILNGGEGQDMLRGEGDNDALVGGPGGDIFAGGPGTDTADYSFETQALNVSIDGLANDGAGEQDNVSTDTENVVTGSGADVISGSDVFNTITSGAGNDSIDVRDGSADAVRCDGGRDVVAADSIDSINGDCESVTTATRAKAAIQGDRFRLNRNGRASLSVRCSGIMRCGGSVSIKRRSKAITSAGFSIEPGKTKAVKLKVRKRLLKSVCNAPTVRATVSTGPLTTSKNLTPSCAKKKRKGGKR